VKSTSYEGPYYEVSYISFSLRPVSSAESFPEHAVLKPPQIRFLLHETKLHANIKRTLKRLWVTDYKYMQNFQNFSVFLSSVCVCVCVWWGGGDARARGSCDNYQNCDSTMGKLTFRYWVNTELRDIFEKILHNIKPEDP
jgi:hypothetical protein